jgi:glycosyltransferase involved in cell wall biosynthesis
LYDRKLVEYLKAHGETIEIISLPWRNYAVHLTDNLRFRLPAGFDIVVQDELNHPSLIRANAGKHPYPIISLVHHLRCSELRPAWQNSFYRIVEKKYLQSLDGIIFNSNTTRAVVEGLIGKHKASVVAFPPTDRFGDPISESAIISRAQSGEFRILFIGNVIRRKGLHVLLKALQGLQASVDVVGGMDLDPKYAFEMQRYVLTHGLSSTVAFHGPLDNQPLVELYERSHVLVVPSSYEGYGIVYLEGMGFGLPAIGTTAGAAGEIITPGTNGYLIQPDDSAALAAHLKELSVNRELLQGLSLNALRRFRAQPKWDTTAGQIHEFLQKQIREFSVQSGTEHE